MNKTEKYVFGFVAAVILFFVMCFAVSAFAQTEKFLQPYNVTGCIDSIGNASSVDGVYATLPSPLPTSGEYAIYFDLGYTLPPFTPLPINIYGKIYPLSNLFVGAIYEDNGEGFSHRVGSKVNDLSLRFNKALRVTYTWAFPVRYIVLLRSCGTTSSQLINGVIIPGISEAENGKPVFIDAVSIGGKPVPMPSWSIHYSRFVINSSLFGKTIK